MVVALSLNAGLLFGEASPGPNRTGLNALSAPIPIGEDLFAELLPPEEDAAQRPPPGVRERPLGGGAVSGGYVAPRT